MNLFISILLVVLVTILGLLGPLVAADFGGVFPWTQFVAAAIICGLTCFAAVLAATNRNFTGRRHLWLLGPLAAWSAFSWFQNFHLPPSWVRLLSPGAHSAYTAWLDPLLSPESLPAKFALSVAPEFTCHAAAFLTLLVSLAYCVCVCCRERQHTSNLLLLLCVAVGLHAVYGIVAYFLPGLNIRSGTIGERGGFGPFVNHNNAAYLLNLGLACGAGTFVFRFVTLHGKGNASSQRSLSRRPIWLDVHAVVAVAVAIACVLGLLVCGSRAGLVAIAVGAITTFAWFRRGHGWKTIPMVLCLFLLTVVAGVLLLSPLASRFRSVERFNRIDIRSSEGLSGDVRFQHWRDGLRAAKYYLPAGSGLSTYGYAYLPYQQHGAGLSFHHADNLWLELLVEQGLVGLAFAAWAIGLLVWSLHRLSRSGDPLDVGLQVAGWYFLGAMLWSQCFDFGLVLPGNLITTMVFIAMLFSRSLTVVNDQSKRASTQGLVFIKAPQRLLATLTGSLIALSGFLSLQPLKADAFLDATISDAKQILESSPADEDSIASRVERLKALASDDPRATLLDLASDLDRQLGRLESTRRIASTRELPFADAYTQAKSSSLRRAWRANQRQAFPETEGYLQAVASSTQSLLRAPLGVRPRANLVQLDFAHRDDQISLSALRQLSVLQSQSPEQLVRLGKLAFDSDERGLSAELWKRATQLDPKLATDAVKFTRATPELVVDQFLDASSQSQLLASMQLLKMPGESVAEKTQAEEFFQLAVERLDCEAYSTIRQRGECYHVTGDILYRLRRFDESFERYAQAILLNPANTRLRFKVIARLCSTDRLEDAIRLAKKSQQDFPEVSRFGTLGSQIEQQSRAESENSQD